MSRTPKPAKEWPIDFWYGVRCFIFLAVLELLLAVTGSFIAKRSYEQVILITCVARVLDVACIGVFLGWRGLGISAVGLNPRLLKKGVFHGLMWGAAVIAGAVLAQWAGIVSFEVSVGAMKTRGGILFLSVGIIFGPAVEEVIFRGWLYGALRNRYNVIAGIMLSALLFGLAHGFDSGRFLLIVTGGVIFGISYELSGSLATPIILHAGGNLIIETLADHVRFWQ